MARDGGPVARDGGGRGGGRDVAAVQVSRLAQEAYLVVRARHTGWEVLVTADQTAIPHVTRHCVLIQIRVHAN